jgi:hypothetical protein
VKIASKRKQLAALFTALDHRPATDIVMLCEDDERFRADCKRFSTANALHRMGNSYAPPLELPPVDGAKIDCLITALLRSVSQARDNELFIVFGNFSNCEADWPKLFQAFRLVRSRHHEVVCVCQRYPVLSDSMPALPGDRLERDVLEALIDHYNNRIERFQKAIRRMGVLFLWADQQSTVGQLVQKMTDLRSARVRR